MAKPVGGQGMLPVVLDVHGGGWVIGNAGTHDRLVREPAVGTDAAVVFVEYDRSPEARYPVTDAAQDTESYREFAAGPSLTAKAMARFWDCCTTDPARRAETTASPLCAEELRGPPRQTTNLRPRHIPPRPTREGL